MTIYHTETSSLYVEIVRVKYENDIYIKAHIRYYTKPSMKLISETRNQKILKEAMKYWVRG